MRSARSRVILAKFALWMIVYRPGQRSLGLSPGNGTCASPVRTATVGRVEGYDAVEADTAPPPRLVVAPSIAPALVPDLASNSRKAPTAPMTPVASLGRKIVDPLPSVSLGKAS